MPFAPLHSTYETGAVALTSWGSCQGPPSLIQTLLRSCSILVASCSKRSLTTAELPLYTIFSKMLRTDLVMAGNILAANHDLYTLSVEAACNPDSHLFWLLGGLLLPL